MTQPRHQQTQSTIMLPKGSPVENFGGRNAPAGATVVSTGTEIREAVARLASDVRAWIENLPLNRPDGQARKVVLAPVLEGGAFIADALMSQLKRDGVDGLVAAPLRVSTRDGDGRTLERATVTLDEESYQGAHVLVLDDIFDSGKTLELTRAALSSRALSVKTLVLGAKDGTADSSMQAPDFVGIRFDAAVSKLWLSGCGMDMPGLNPGEVDRARQERCIIGYPPIVDGDFKWDGLRLQAP